MRGFCGPGMEISHCTSAHISLAGIWIYLIMKKAGKCSPALQPGRNRHKSGCTLNSLPQSPSEY